MYLEDIFQCKLKLARVVTLAGDSAERSAGRIHDRNAPVRMIQNVEHLETELKRLGFINPEVLSQSHVPGTETWTSEKIPGLNAIGSGGWLGEGRRIKPSGKVREGSRLQRRIAHQTIELITPAQPNSRDIFTAANR